MHSDRQDLTTRHVRAAIGDDRESADWIVRRFSPLLEAQARMRLSGTPVPAAEAEDVVAESWLITLPRLREIAPREGRFTPVLLTFLATTVRALCNRRIEKRLRVRVDPLLSGDQTPEKPVRSHGAHDHEFSRRIRDALDALGEPTRTIVLLRAVEGLENSEIADELGEAPNTISHRYRRALEKLRSVLPDSVFDELDDG